MEGNIALNSELIEAGGGSAVAFPLVWGVTDCSTLDRRWHCPEVVVAADVIYHRELMTPLFQAMSSLGEARFHAQFLPYSEHSGTFILLEWACCCMLGLLYEGDILASTCMVCPKCCNGQVVAQPSRKMVSVRAALGSGDEGLTRSRILIVAAEGGTQVILAHVRRWKHDKLFFKMAKRGFQVEDVTDKAGPGFVPTSGEVSHTKGALRIYELTNLQRTI